MNKHKVNIGLLGLGRLGRLYARYLRMQIPEVRLAAVCDVEPRTLNEVADEVEVSTRYLEPDALIHDPAVDAVVIVTPTTTHRGLVEAAAAAGKPIFCEKPLSISLDDALAAKAAVDRSGAFFQMGFMRRFDRGYVAARKRMDAGEIGQPMVFKATSRDPFRPSLDYLATSGGLFVDMGIHDFDLALWLFGDIAGVHSVGSVLAYPEIEAVGDIDNAITTLRFGDGRIGVVDLSRNGVYGYDIATEILGTRGTLRIGYLRENPVLVMKKNSISHDTVPHFMERFAESYVTQLRDFARNLLAGAPPPITVDDGIRALRVAIAATRSYRSKTSVTVEH
jgi:inositol 2-dehydrogenase